MSYRDRDRDEPYSRDKGSSRYSFEKKADAAPKVFVGNIPYTTSDEEVKAHFESAGRVQEVLIPRDPEGRIKGFGFITFEDFDSMERAIRKMDGSSLLGNTLRVDRANERKERPAFDSRGPPPSRGYDGSRGGGGYGGGHGGSGHGGGGYGGGGERRERKPVGYRCRIMGLAREVGWQLLKDFLRQAGDVTYANVDPDGMGVGEYQSLAECRDAIEKLSGAALDGKIVKLTPLNFDFETGERLDRAGGGAAAGGGYSSRSYHDDRGRGGDGYSSGRRDNYDRREDRRDDRDRRDYGGGGRDYDRRGGSGGRDYSPRSDRGGGSHRDYDRAPAAAAAGGRSGGYSSPPHGGGGRDYDRGRSRERSPPRAAAAAGGHGDRDRDYYREPARPAPAAAAAAGGGGSYNSPRAAAPVHQGGGGSARPYDKYDSPRGNGGGPAGGPPAGGSSRYGGGGWSGGSSKYGGGAAAAAAPPAGSGGSSRYGGGGGDAGYRGVSGGDGGGGDGYYGDSRGGGGPDRSGCYREGRGSDRQGPYDRPASAR
uniref:RRM domain-containing protein n=1 Tax=Tetradesmus obliquus TaxID=3088 RepID=A0A383WI16_TETOB|eukprot:jgi/Sobl393_1/579/SZX69751.1